MREYIIRYNADEHSAMLNGAYLWDNRGETMDEFTLVVKDRGEQILDIIKNETFGYVVTLVFNQAGVNLILNEETGQIYFVDYHKLHSEHTFPTMPPVTVTLVDYA